MSSRNAEKQAALIHSGGENVVLLTPNETAARLRISESTLAKWRMTGDGPEFVKMGAKVRYPENGIAQFIARRARRSTSQTEAAA